MGEPERNPENGRTGAEAGRNHGPRRPTANQAPLKRAHQTKKQLPTFAGRIPLRLAGLPPGARGR